ncbi:MAG: ATP-binding protein [Bacteroidota bacterium]
MKLSTKYILFIILIHGTALVMSYFIFEENKLLFIASEVLILLSLYFSYQLYTSMVQPIKLINQGADAMRDRDFTVKFQGVGQMEMDNLIEVYNQMMDQLREERVEKVQKHFFLEKLIQNSPTAILVLNLDKEISSLNPKAEEYIGQKSDQLLGMKPEDSEWELLQYIAQIPAGKTQIVSVNGIETFKCHKAQFIDRGFANYFVMIEELTAEKLEIEKQAYGKVIRMMAHEVNNSIGPINSILESLGHYAQFLPKEEKGDYQEVLEIAHQRNEKLNEFMRNFANVVKLPEPILEEADVRDLVERMANFMSFQRKGKEIKIRTQLPEDKVMLSFDPRQMEQVLINVIKNGIEAIETRGEVLLSLQANPPILRIIDDGQGISKDISQKLFSPFYSSKKNGQGIGLTLTREILLQHDFPFSLRTGRDKGAVFEIRFT